MKKFLNFIIAGIILSAIIWACEKSIQENHAKSTTHSKSVKLVQRSAIDDCFDNTDCYQTQDSAVQLINVNGYSPCQIYAIYDLWACYSLGGVLLKFTIANFQVGLISNGCDSLQTRWDSILAIPDYNQYNYEMDVFYLAAKSSLERYLMGQFFANSSHRDSFPCAGGSYGTLTTEFYSALCYKWCAVELGGIPPVTILTQIICGDACCKREVEWCWDTAHSTYYSGYPSYTDYGDCGNSPLYNCSGTSGGGNCADHDCEP